MSQTQQTVVPTENLALEEPTALPVELESGSWEPYLSLMQNWQRADEICAKASDRAEVKRNAEEERTLALFTSDKVQVEAERKERLERIEAERKATTEHADSLLNQTKTTQNRVRKAMRTVGLEALTEGIEATSSSLERSDATTALSSLQDAARNSILIENSLQEDLFDLRAARQRQSAQMWGVGIGLWCVAVVVFAPYSWISAILIALAAFVIATPRKIGRDEPLRPSFSWHITHSIALLFGKQQVMQHPFSLLEREVSGTAFSGAVVMACIAWLLLLWIGVPTDYRLIESLKNLALVSVASIIAGSVTFAVSNNDITFTELDEGEKNKILK
ncbi:hypothetical protein EON83_14350 [bacterium]|nr:MAG: hypothetical protein EON83_14350 [bacterium]